MPGPRTPYGYPPIFHDLLAQIVVESPQELEIISPKSPHHLRALFNQFRSSWLKEAEAHRKLKQTSLEIQSRENYAALMRYECKPTPTGIILTHRSAFEARLEVRGAQTLPAKINIAPSPSIDDETIRNILKGEKSEAKPDPVIPHNPPKNSEGNA